MCVWFLLCYGDDEVELKGGGGRGRFLNLQK